MSLRKKNIINTFVPQTDPFQPSPNIYNSINQQDPYTNFNPRKIDLENIDEAFFMNFNNRFIIAGKQLNLISLDSDLASMEFQNVLQFDELTKYLNFPYFTFWRSNTAPWWKISPSNKPIIYTIPKTKAQGLVYEEYIMVPPKPYKLTYTVKFLTTFREYTNKFEEQMAEYFKNKSNVLFLDGERFEIRSVNQDDLATLTVVDREGVNGQSLYILSYELCVYGFLRKPDDIQKRERINTFSLKIKEDRGKTTAEIKQIASRLPK